MIRRGDQELTGTRKMPKQPTMLLCATAGAVTAAILCGWTPDVSAQDCNDRYPCQALGRPPLQGTQPLPVTPQVFAPYGAQEPEPMMPPGPARLPPGGRSGAARPVRQPLCGLGSEPFPVPAVDLGRIDPQFLRRTVSYPTSEPPGTIVIDPGSHFLYLVQGGGQAIRYGVGVGREGFGWSGTANLREKREWPDWYPPKEMIQRQPELRRQLTELQSGIGMPGGPRNPLGARALYLWQGNKDTLYRIHGTVEPWTIGSSVSSGCIRMINQDVIDLYQRAPINAKVVVLGSRG